MLLWLFLTPRFTFYLFTPVPTCSFYSFYTPHCIHLIAIVLVSSVQYPRPLLTVRLKPSKCLAVILSLAHFTATGLLWPLTIPVMMKLAGSAILAATLFLYTRYYALLTSPKSVRGLKLALDSTDAITCTLETQRGDYIACALLGSSFVAPYLTVLELKPLGARRLWQRFRKRSVVILPDGIDVEEFRQLRVLLRWRWKNAQEAH